MQARRQTVTRWRSSTGSAPIVGLWLIFTVAPGCSAPDVSTASTPAVAPSPSGSVQSTPAIAARCEPRLASTLPGVAIRFPEQPCSFQAGAIDAVFRWELVVDADTPVLTHRPMKPCTGLNEHGFSARERVSGGDLSFEERDGGECSEVYSTTAHVKKGVHARTFAWDGTRWDGPGCTEEPHGPPFPAGTYAFVVELAGTDESGAPWEVRGALPITLE